jgi:hypothetical protein
MLVLHFVIFFIYAAMCTPDINIDPHPNGIQVQNPLQAQLQKFKQTLQTSSTALTNTITNPYNLIQYEPSYPQQTRIHNFPTHASQQEMAKHDRYIIHGILYSEMLTRDYLQQHWSIPDTSHSVGPWKLTRKLCINITMKNRSVPYINALLMTLMMSHAEGENVIHLNPGVKAGHRLLSYAELNLLDAERRDKTYDEIRGKHRNLEFLHHYDVMEMVKQGNRDSRRLIQIQDFLVSARICVKSGLDWCLMMEEFTVVPLNFLDSLKRFVISPLESYIAAHRFEGSDSGERLSDGDVIRKKMSLVSLFSAYDSQEGGLMKVHDVEYSRNKYEKDRAKLNSERRALSLKEHSFEYEMHPIYDHNDGDAAGARTMNAFGGFDSAMLFHTSMVKNELIPMLTKLLEAEERKLWGEWARKGFTTGTKESSEENEQHDDANALDLEREFSLYTGIKRYRVEPSLVNRIGFYDDEFDSRHREENDLGITNWLTDPRFLFEAGPY